MNLLENHPLPWDVVALPAGYADSNEKDVIDANGRPVMRVKTNLRNHQAVVDLISHILPDRMLELKHLATEPAPIGWATQKLLDIIAKELATPQHPGSVYFSVPMNVCEGFLEEHGVAVPESKKQDPNDPRWTAG